MLITIIEVCLFLGYKFLVNYRHLRSMRMCLKNDRLQLNNIITTQLGLVSKCHMSDAASSFYWIRSVHTIANHNFKTG